MHAVCQSTGTFRGGLKKRGEGRENTGILRRRIFFSYAETPDHDLTEMRGTRWLSSVCRASADHGFHVCQTGFTVAVSLSPLR